MPITHHERATVSDVFVVYYSERRNLWEWRGGEVRGTASARRKNCRHKAGGEAKSQTTTLVEGGGLLVRVGPRVRDPLPGDQALCGRAGEGATPRLLACAGPASGSGPTLSTRALITEPHADPRAYDPTLPISQARPLFPVPTIYGGLNFRKEIEDSRQLYADRVLDCTRHAI